MPTLATAPLRLWLYVYIVSFYGCVVDFVSQDGLAKVCLYVCHAPGVTLRVSKPRSLLHAHSAAIEITREAQDFVAPDGTPFDYRAHLARDLELQKSKGTAYFLEQEGDILTPDLRALYLSPTSKWALEDRVFVRDLVINAFIGINPWERVDKQNILVNLTIFSGDERLRQAATRHSQIKMDYVSRPHNFRTIVRSITEYVSASSHKTVESLATSIARVAITQNGVDRIRVRVDKPSAIMFARSAGVEIERDRAFFEADDKEVQVTPPLPPLKGGETPISLEEGWHLAAIALGANLGDRFTSLERAVDVLHAHPAIRVVDTSFLYETPPMYVLDQPKFLNGAVRIATRLTPLELLRACQDIEFTLGRDKEHVPDKGPRSVDLDILLYDQLEVHDAPTLVIPHPLMKEREFVLRPLVDVLPHYEHPGASKTILQLLSLLHHSPDYPGDQGIRRVSFAPVPRASPTALTKQPASVWSWGSKTLVMGILNATPDSFSDGGDHFSAQDSAKKAEEMVAAGADILDVGGLSTAPGTKEISVEEEIARVVPVIKAVRAAGITVPISIDTFNGPVAQAALEAGANMVNDVSGGVRDPAILDVTRTWRVPYICMHMRGDSGTMNSLSTYANDDVLTGVRNELQDRVMDALKAGVRRWHLILDPGIGFAKNQEGNLTLLRDLSQLTQSAQLSPAARLPPVSSHTGSAQPSRPGSPPLVPMEVKAGSDLVTPNARLCDFPVLVGASRKRFLGAVTGRSEPKDRVFGTAAACAAAIFGGADIVRVHDVAEMVDVAKMTDAIVRSP